MDIRKDADLRMILGQGVILNAELNVYFCKRV